MESRGNYVIVGAFALVVLTAALGFILWLSQSRDNFLTKQYIVEFKGSVQGLSANAPVYFNGISVGRVIRISFNPDNPQAVSALIEISDATPVRVDTRAQLNYQGVTGVADIQLTGASNTAQVLEGSSENPPIIIAEPSLIQDLIAGGREVLSEARILLTRTSAILGENGGLINSSMRNVDKFTSALADNTDQVEEFMQSVGGAAKSISKATDRLDNIVAKADTLAEDIDTQSLADTFKEVQAFTNTIAGTREEVAKVVTNANIISTQLTTTTAKINNILTVVESVDEEQVKQLLGGTTQTLDEFKLLANTLNKETTRFVDRVERVGSNIEKFTEDDLANVSGMIDKGGETLDEYKNVAIKLNQEIEILANSLNRVTADLENLSNRSLKDVSSVLQDAKRAARSVNSAAKKLESNPQSILTGNSTRKPTFDNNRR